MEKTIYGPDQRALQELLRKVRLEAGLRQQDLADRIDEPQAFVSRYETGQRRLDVLELRLICRALGTTLPAFVERLEATLRRSSSGGRRKRS